MSVTGTTDITTTSTSYTDMTDMEIRFVSSGRPVKISFVAPVFHTTDGSGIVCALDIAGTEKIASHTRSAANGGDAVMVLNWVETLAAGTHTIKIQWKSHTTGTIHQEGATKGNRILICEEM